MADLKDASNELSLAHKLLIEQQKLFSVRVSGTTIPALIELINPSQKILSNTKVKYRVGGSFEDLLNGSEPFDFLPGEILDSSVLIQKACDSQIVPLIGMWTQKLTKERILYRIIHLTEKQSKGEEGLLLTNGQFTNVGYFKNERGLHCTAAVLWHPETEEWQCEVFNFGNIDWDINEGLLTETGILHKPADLMN